MDVGVVGLGYWGKNIVRNLVNCSDVDKIFVFDKDDEKNRSIKSVFPSVIIKKTFEEILKTDIEAIFIVTPPESHFELGLKVLESGKHLYLEKPFVIFNKR